MIIKSVLSPIDGIINKIQNNSIIIKFKNEPNFIKVNLNGSCYHIIVDENSIVVKDQTILGYICQVRHEDKLIILNNLMKNLNKKDLTWIVNNFYGAGSDETLKQLIVVTAPHQKCEKDSYKRHTCDTYAGKLLQYLGKNLQNEKRKIILYKANINRIIMDFNRKESYDSDFRKLIRKKVNEHIDLIKKQATTSHNNIIYILDCHSFPNYSSFTNVRIKNPLVSILFDDCSQLVYVDELISIFTENDIPSTKHIGIKNDIVDEFIKLNKNLSNIIIIPILIEVKENISDNHMEIITKCISKWIDTINNYLVPK